MDGKILRPDNSSYEGDQKIYVMSNSLTGAKLSKIGLGQGRLIVVSFILL